MNLSYFIWILSVYEFKMKQFYRYFVITKFEKLEITSKSKKFQIPFFTLTLILALQLYSISKNRSKFKKKTLGLSVALSPCLGLSLSSFSLSIALSLIPSLYSLSLHLTFFLTLPPSLSLFVPHLSLAKGRESVIEEGERERGEWENALIQINKKQNLQKVIL